MDTAPVIIVGAGAAGCTLALLLARRNLPTILVEQRTEPRRHPAAHVINARTLEIWYEASPALVREVESIVPPIHDFSTIRWCTNVHADPLGELDLLANPEMVRQSLGHSPFRISHLGQHLLTPLLWKAVESEERIDFRRGWCADLAGQTVHLTKPGNPPVEVTARYIIAADGANSKLRDAAGIVMEGPVLANMGSVFLHAPSLHATASARPLLSWIYNPRFCGVIIAHADDDYVVMTPYLHRAQAIAQRSREYWTKLLPHVIGSDTEYKIHSTGTWTMTSQTASSFRRAKLVLIGDAAHRFPHTGGFGLNSGVQDAHNIAWKLAAILHLGAPDSLLDTYETERRPVITRFAAQSTSNHFKLDEVTAELGISNRMLHHATTIAANPWLSWIPNCIAAAIADFLSSAQISRARIISDPRPYAENVRQSIAKKIPEQLEHFASPGLEFGYAYQGPLIDTSEGPCPDGSATSYNPTTHPGARLPHTKIFNQSSDDASSPRHTSLHHMIKADGLTLFTPDPSKWTAGLESSSVTVPISIVSLNTTNPELRKSGLALLKIEDHGAVLVRPDAHVIWRSHDDLNDISAEIERLQKFLAPVWSTIYPPPNNLLSVH
jgi:2-polyprenyl-6-methoxyphenol hydroxylase-like FAD-dependent oxidoreductase